MDQVQIDFLQIYPTSRALIWGFSSIFQAWSSLRNNSIKFTAVWFIALIFACFLVKQRCPISFCLRTAAQLPFFQPNYVPYIFRSSLISKPADTFNSCLAHRRLQCLFHEKNLHSFIWYYFKLWPFVLEPTVCTQSGDTRIHAVSQL